MQRLAGTVQHYAWGSPDAIPAILGTEPSDQPVAEYWLGAHASAPSVLADGNRLDAELAEHPEDLGAASQEAFGNRLPYLLKLLAASQPLSLQAHPSRKQAEEGFAAENERGIPLDAPERTYRDSWPKPELLVALTPFEALCGFRDPAITTELFSQLGMAHTLDAIIGPLITRSGQAGLAEAFLDALSGDESRQRLTLETVAAAVQRVDDPGPLGEFARTAVELDEHHPGDPSILAALLLNRVSLNPGEAIYLPAGNMHAYLRGTGVELMANSDNVLRGGLTAKHIDVPELVRVVNFAAAPALLVPIEVVAPGVTRYLTPAPEFGLWRLELADEVRVQLPHPSARILLVTSGQARATDNQGTTIDLTSGQAIFVPAADVVTVTGTGTAFMAAPGISLD